MKRLFLFIGLTLTIWRCNYFPQKKIINLGLTKGIVSIDPAKAFDSKSLKIVAQSYETLYEYHYLQRPYKLIPLLAEGSPEWLKDGKTVKIKIKKGVFYHDHPAFSGKDRQLIAQDFVTQIKRIAYIPTRSPGRTLISGTILGLDAFTREVNDDFVKFQKNTISGLSTPDDYTLIIKLENKISNFEFFLTLNFFSPLPMEVVKFNNNNLDRVIVGTGPFSLDYFDPLRVVTLKRFSKYRSLFYPQEGDRKAVMEKLLDYANKTMPFLDEVQFHLVDNDRELIEKFLDGDLDVLEDFSPAKLDEILDQNGDLKKDLKEKGIIIKRFEGLTNSWLGMNMKDPLLSNNLNLRMALAHAIDAKKYNRVIRRNISLEANSILTPGIPGYDPSHSLPFNYDLILAKKYLKKAGYPHGRGLPPLVYATRTKEEASLKEAEYIKHQFAQIGIKIDIKVLDFPEFLRKGRNGELQLFTDNWVYDFPEPLNILQLLVTKNFPGINKSGFSNKEFDRLFDNLEQNNEPRKWKKMLIDIEKIFDKELPWIMLSYGRSIVLINDKVKNYRKSDLIKGYIKYLDIK